MLNYLLKVREVAVVALLVSPARQRSPVENCVGVSEVKRLKRHSSYAPAVPVKLHPRRARRYHLGVKVKQVKLKQAM